MAWLDTHRPARSQWYAKRSRALTGCTVLHTSEGVMDAVGPDTGTANLAEFIRTRSTPGSYHDAADSDSNLQLVDYDHGAFHDGTGSNNWALSISFVCRTTDWDRMTPARRRGFLRQGALAFKRQQDYRRRIGAPLTELRLISKAQSDRGESGFTYHGYRDPGRRSDPGVAPPNDFPIDEFIDECRAVMAGEEDDMPNPEDLWAFRYQSPLSKSKVSMAVLLSAAVEHAYLGRIAAEQGKRIAEAAAKSSAPLSDEDVQRIADATAAEFAEDFTLEGKATVQPKPDA